MASVWMRGKMSKLVAQRREAGKEESLKSLARHLDDPDDRANMDRAIVAYDGPITKCPPKEASGLQRDLGKMGKGQRTRATKCYGDGRRTIGTADDRASEYDAWRKQYSASWDLFTKT